MPKKYVKRTRRPRKAARRPRKRTGTGYVTKKQVARMIGRNIEDKYDYNFANSEISNQISNSPYFTQLNWTTAQGNTQGTRVGNQLRVKSAVVKGSLNMRDYSALTNSRELGQLVTLVVFKLKTYLAGTNPTYANTFSRMFQQGNTAVPLTNYPLDHIRTFNKDVFTIKAVRRFKMGFSYPTPNFGSVAPAGTIAPNNDFKYQQFFRIPLTKFYKKTQMFDDTSGAADARNDNLFMMVFCAPADGSAFTSTPLSISWDWEGKFEDA